MKAVVFPNTHAPTRAARLPETLTANLPSADLIVHAGDFVTIKVPKELERHALCRQRL